MFAVIVSEKGGGTERHEFNQNEVTIGRVQGNDIILGKGNVSKRHSRLVLKDGRFIVVDLKSTNGTYVNGRKVTSPLVVKPGDKIYIGDFSLTIEGQAGTQSSPVGRGESPSEPAPPAEYRSPPPPPPTGVSQRPAFGHEPSAPSGPSGSSPRHAPVGEKPPKTWEPPRREIAQEASRSAPVRGPIAEVGSRGSPTKHTSAYDVLASAIGDRNLRLVMLRLEAELDVTDVSIDAMRDESRWTEAERAAERTVRQLVFEGQLEDADHSRLVASAVREAVGLGVLESLLVDEGVREIVVSGPSSVLVDYGQGLTPAESTFSDGRMLMVVLRRLAAKASAYLERGVPVHQFPLWTGAVASILLPPLAVSGPTLEIRRIQPAPTLDELVTSHVLSSDARAAILRAVTGRRSIAVVGPSGSGVTVTVAAIAAATASDERLIVASDHGDLRIDRAGVVLLGAGPGGEKPSLLEVIGHATHLRSDRLVVDGVGQDELAVVLERFASRSGGDLVGIRARAGDSAVSTIRRMLVRSGVSERDADATLLASIDLVVELDATRGVRRIVRVAELRGFPDGSAELVDLPS